MFNHHLNSESRSCNSSIIHSICVGPWFVQTCTGCGLCPESTEVSPQPSCCPQTNPPELQRDSICDNWENRNKATYQTRSVQQLKLFLSAVRFWTYRCLNSAYRIRFGKPFLQILIPSRTPLHLNWWRTRNGSITPANQTGTLGTSCPTASRRFLNAQSSSFLVYDKH